ncbi:hypothetical protein KTN05_15760 [Paracoccus sp. Z118]|uniref:hypothetical protein n=1 Tax=Paracoccus sp. Z118 TaxID=2851017 RepID=UPI001C2C31DA|nr:hypothetical protein [Paracoccus sp. Z118]MBV0893270.1 hypothetical protein [Paracoccus sp. Z118]
MNPLARFSRSKKDDDEAAALPEIVHIPTTEQFDQVIRQLDFPQLFRNLERHYDKGKSKLERYATTTAGEGGFLRKGRSDYLRALNRVLNTLLDSYTAGIYTESRKLLQMADEELEASRNSLDEFRRRLLFAQPGKGSPSIIDRAYQRDFTLDSEFYLTERIGYAERQIALLEVSREKILLSFCLELHHVYAWDIDESQARILLYQANGGSIVQAVEVVRIVHHLETMLAQTRKHTANPDNLRKYYGMAVMTRLLLLLMYEAHIVDYDDKWLPALKKRAQSNQKLMDETAALMKCQMTAAGRAQLQRNLSIQRNTNVAISQYEIVLLQRLKKTQEARDAVAIDAELALNTFKTLDDAIGFSSEVAAFNYDHDSLTALTPGDLVPLYDEDLSALYLEISQELRTS